ncbi:hypothetical protein B0T18DRAFT_421148 [Schizothecium vesticola]|uniref:Uncharacterized protein n=1 Tax=Schizothecium vesticola TaxID=314040 RepID=A0AA40BPM9_9PEZI|nr:hypothetical protein B0T18DRAFT_421148 [Schizothecium vesticola]
MGIAGLNTRISKVKDAITKALQQYSGWCGRFKIYIGLIGEVVEGNYGQAQPVTDGTTFGHCNVLVSAANDIISVDALQRIQKSVAHEIYHCLQYAQNLAGKRKAAKGRDDWWIEGTARFMDGELYPIAPGSGVVNLGIFPEHYDPRVSIVEQPGKGYAASLFFHYLLTTGHTLSNINQWVSKKIGQKSVASDLADLAADTSPHLSFPKNWHGFAVAFASRTIKYLSSGDLIELTSNPPSVTLSRNLAVGQTRALSRSIKSFTFDVVRYTFPVNTTNSLQFPDTATTLRCSYRLRGRTFWDSARAGLSISIQPVASGTSYIDTLCSCSAATTCSDTFNIERSL